MYKPDVSAVVIQGRIISNERYHTMDIYIWEIYIVCDHTVAVPSLFSPYSIL